MPAEPRPVAWDDANMPEPFRTLLVTTAYAGPEACRCCACDADLSPTPEGTPGRPYFADAGGWRECGECRKCENREK